MLDMISRDITAPYSAAEAWIYDTFIADSVNAYVRELQGPTLTDMPAAARVLDVGCGGGQNACSLADTHPGVTVTGLDLSPRQVARARRRARPLGDRATFIEGSALELPFPEHAFDVVVSIGSIKHWPDMRLGVSECVRVLHPGGRLLIAEVDRGCRLDDARAFVSRWRIPRVMRPIALAGFRTWIAGQGIDIDDARSLLDGLPLTELRAERVPNTPFLLMGGCRVAAST